MLVLFGDLLQTIILRVELFDKGHHGIVCNRSWFLYFLRDLPRRSLCFLVLDLLCPFYIFEGVLKASVRNSSEKSCESGAFFCCLKIVIFYLFSRRKLTNIFSLAPQLQVYIQSDGLRLWIALKLLQWQFIAFRTGFEILVSRSIPAVRAEHRISKVQTRLGT